MEMSGLSDDRVTEYGFKVGLDVFWRCLGGATHVEETQGVLDVVDSRAVNQVGPAVEAYTCGSWGDGESEFNVACTSVDSCGESNERVGCWENGWFGEWCLADEVYPGVQLNERLVTSEQPLRA